MRMALASLAALFLVSGCNPLDRTPEPTAPQGTPEYLQQQQQICEAEGGTFGTGPGGATRVCFIEPEDANQPCSSARDCDGLCLARSRTCAPIKPLFGCHEALLDNGRPATVCLD